MVTLMKENVPLLNKADLDKKNILVVRSQNNPPYHPVFIAKQVIAFAEQSDGASIHGILHAFAETMADEPITTENPDIIERRIRQLQSQMSGKSLTHRELQVLNHVAEGTSNKEIARELYISQQTVKNYMSSIMRKLQAKNRAHAVILAIRQGWMLL